MKTVLRCILAPAAFLTLLLGSGCTRRVYVPVQSERVRTDSVRLYSRGTDTVTRLDSVVLTVRGDTVTREVWRVRERVRTLADDATHVVHDTVRVERPVALAPATEQKSSNRWREWCEAVSAAAMCVAAGVICITIIKRCRL